MLSELTCVGVELWVKVVVGICDGCEHLEQFRASSSELIAISA